MARDDIAARQRRHERGRDIGKPWRGEIPAESGVFFDPSIVGIQNRTLKSFLE